MGDGGKGGLSFFIVDVVVLVVDSLHDNSDAWKRDGYSNECISSWTLSIRDLEETRRIYSSQ